MIYPGNRCIVCFWMTYRILGFCINIRRITAETDWYKSVCCRACESSFLRAVQIWHTGVCLRSNALRYLLLGRFKWLSIVRVLKNYCHYTVVCHLLRYTSGVDFGPLDKLATTRRRLSSISHSHTLLLGIKMATHMSQIAFGVGWLFGSVSYTNCRNYLLMSYSLLVIAVCVLGLSSGIL